MTAPMLFIAQTSKGDSTSVIIMSGLLIGVVVALTVVLLLIRNKAMSTSRDQDHTGSLMDQLRQMRNDGRITEQEFQAARDKMKERLAASVKSDESNEQRGAARDR